MKIVGTDLGKKFEKRWIFRNISVDLEQGETLAITGSNGSGKSTLLQILANSLTPSFGSVKYFANEQPIEMEETSGKIGYCAPYIELIEELTLKEHLEFHSKFCSPSIAINDMIDRIGYQHAVNQSVREFSSGMKQRLRLALSFFFEAEVNFFDEPTSNLDESGVAWYLSEIKSLLGERIILIASNQRYEYDFCTKRIQLTG
jgi:ABC-type multidrug transport system ATPase subunit